ncbi:unnamed protein product, partial [Vitis vinifera]|uniref:Uncharacterized protein n=1 Tax=Vitis vinifera TaxID=29760 RepID=D7TSC7_VITVI
MSIEIHVLETFVCKDLLNPILISMNSSIKTPLIGAMNFNSYVFKTKIHFEIFSKLHTKQNRQHYHFGKLKGEVLEVKFLELLQTNYNKNDTETM